MAIERFGSWASPVSAEALVARSVSLGEVHRGRRDLWWAEGRPEEGGRTQLVRRAPDGTSRDVLADGVSVRTRVHEYGGGAWWLRGDDVVFAEWTSQRLWLLVDGEERPRPLTPECDGVQCFADGRVTPDGRWTVCVRERAVEGAEPVSELVAVRLDPSSPEGDQPIVLVAGADFHATPRVSPDGARLAFVRWSHPHMPWDVTELCVSELTEIDDVLVAGEPRVVAGGVDESISEPQWWGERLVFISDRTGWWNLHDVDLATGVVSPIATIDAEIGMPHWVFDNARYAGLDDGRIVVAFLRDGFDHLGVVIDGAVRELDLPFTSYSSLRADGGQIVAVAASMTAEPAVVRIGGFGLDEMPSVEVLRAPRELPVGPGSISVAEPISFPTSGGRTAHALFYPPCNERFEGSIDERPPLIVLSHGGPTSAARPQFSLALQYWTTRGFAVVDVNYGGSTGYGRAYRRQLDGAWGIVDVDDCAAAAMFLVERGDVDGDRLIIRGGSAGGYTTLCALTFTDVFDAGASLYGIVDLETLATDTHKFEARYLDSLVGPYPARRDLYVERSPIHHTDRLSCPVIVLQGLDDKVVPPSQAEQMVAALAAKGLPHEYVAFEGEGHGFRRAESIVRAIEAEASFYARVLGFDLADDRSAPPPPAP